MGTNGKVAQLHKPFRNRITGAGMERVDQLLANPANWRLHPDNQQQALAGAIDDLGFIRSVTVNRTTGCVLDGHLRVTLAARSGVDELPVEYVELSPAEEAEALLTLDPIGAMAAADKAKLDDLMRQVNSDDERVQRMIAELAEREHIQYGDPPPDDPGVQIDRAEELREKWGVETGQLWRLGEHRLICGDCTDRAVVERVMGGEKADCGFADPPYNLDIEYADNYNDSKSYIEYDAFTNNWWSEFNDCVDGTKVVTPGIANVGLWYEIRKPDWIAAWVKMNGQSRNKFGGTNKWEPILLWDVPYDQGIDVFDANNDYTEKLKNGFHPVSKPPELSIKIIERFSKVIVVDPFLGSGTTLIACERLGRKCRAVEISPAYCAVAIERWAQMTGKEPELIA